MPAGTQPPLIINYDASTVPVLQIAYSSKVLSEQQLLDLAQNTIRPHLATVRGAAIARRLWRQAAPDAAAISIPRRCRRTVCRPRTCRPPWATRPRSFPPAIVKIGAYQYTVKLNDAADTIEGLNDLPIKTVGGATVFLRDVGHARDGNAPQNNVVHAYGGRAVLSTILKNGNASTLDVVDGVKQTAAPAQEPAARHSCKIDFLNDQSHLRESGGGRRGARRHHRRRPHQPDDPAVPGQLALHRDHRHLHSAGGAVRR